MNTTTRPMALHETTAQRFQSLQELLTHADKLTAGDNLGATWNARLVLAQAALEELKAEHAAMAGDQQTQQAASVEGLLHVARGAAHGLLRCGLVLRAEQRPLLPLCQGNYETVVYAVPGRGVVA